METLGGAEERSMNRSTDENQDGLDRLDLLIASGWGDTPQARIPKGVLEAAEAGRMPRQNPRRRRNDYWRVGPVRNEERAA